MADCLFCKMVSGEIRPELVYENDRIMAFRDINPQAPVHVLVIPKQHIPTVDALTDPGLAGEILIAARDIAASEGLPERGYRIVINCNSDGGQDVFHLHLHVLGGRQLSWPPG